MKLPSKLALVIILAFAHTSVFAQSKKELGYKIDSLIKTQSPRPFNGVVLITKNGKTKYSKAYGFRNFNAKVQLKSGDRFEVMSITKQVTAVLLLKEVEKGTVDLQAPIKRYLPALTKTWADSVTVHQLLTHTHGIIDTEAPLEFAPGTNFKYSNLSYILLGQIIENVTHKSYRELADALFHSLKMKNTSCYSNTVNNKNRVFGHINRDNKFTVIDTPSIDDFNLPAAGVLTTAKDLSVWNSKLHNGKILKPESYKLMTAASALSQHDVFGKEKMGYGYGIRIVEDNGLKYFGHTGLGDGFAALNIYIPDADVSLIVLENQMGDGGSLHYYFEAKIKELLLKSDLVKKGVR